MKAQSLAVAFAAISAAAAELVNVKWSYDAKSTNSSIRVYDKDDGLIAMTCGSYLDVPLAIDFTSLSANSTREIKVDTETYPFADVGDGPRCSYQYNENFKLADCTHVPWHNTPVAAEYAGEKICFSSLQTRNQFFHHEQHRKRVLYARSGDDEDLGHIDDVDAENDADDADDEDDVVDDSLMSRLANLRFWSRQDDVCGSPKVDKTPVLEGDGNPAQVYFLQQLTEAIWCGPNQTCSASRTQSESTTKSYTTGLMGSKVFRWFTGGFGVTKSLTITTSYSCDGESNQTVAVWANIAHTRYTAKRKGAKKECITTDLWSANVYRSPNADNEGGYYYCVIGEQFTRSKNDNYWADAPPGPYQGTLDKNAPA